MRSNRYIDSIWSNHLENIRCVQLSPLPPCLGHPTKICTLQISCFCQLFNGLTFSHKNQRARTSHVQNVGYHTTNIPIVMRSCDRVSSECLMFVFCLSSFYNVSFSYLWRAQLWRHAYSGVEWPKNPANISTNTVLRLLCVRNDWYMPRDAHVFR